MFYDEENIVPQVQGSSVPDGVSTGHSVTMAIRDKHLVYDFVLLFLLSPSFVFLFLMLLIMCPKELQCLCQVKNPHILEGGWCGGDAWFGGVT
jgi:hypothetical protein